MKRIGWVVLASVALVATVQAEDFNCTQLPGKVKRFVSCGKAIVQADIPLDVAKSLTRMYPTSKILSGDLDNDGINDYVIYATEQTGNEMADRIVILKGKSGGGFEDLAKSSHIEYGKADIELKNQSLYILVSNNTLKESNKEIYQFKYKNGGLFLIGKEEREDVTDEGNISNTSTNYLTGVEIETDYKNGKKISETRSRVERTLLKLEDFVR